MLAAVTQCPAYVWRVRLGPPAIELGEIEAAVGQHLHAAGAARFPRPARRIDPDVHALHQLLREGHVVVLEEDRSQAHRIVLHELRPSLHERVAWSSTAAARADVRCSAVTSAVPR